MTARPRGGPIPGLVRLVDGAATVGVWFGGALLLLVAVVVGVDVVLRKAFALSLGGADELAGYALAISSAWAFSFTLLKRSHIRIDFIYNRCPANLRHALDLVTLAAVAGFAALLGWRAWGVLGTSLALGARANTPWATPLWIPQSLWFAGLAFLVVTALVLLCATSVALAAGDRALAQRLAGMSDIQEEIEAEMHEAEKQLGLAPKLAAENR